MISLSDAEKVCWEFSRSEKSQEEVTLPVDYKDILKKTSLHLMSFMTPGNIFLRSHLEYNRQLSMDMHGYLQEDIM